MQWRLQTRWLRRALIALCLNSLILLPPAFTQTNVLTYHNDNFRTGQDLTESRLTLQNVNSASFGRLFTLSVDGKVDAQPLYVSRLAMPALGVHDVVFVATEHDSVYAFDANTGAKLWSASMLGSTTRYPSSFRPLCRYSPLSRARRNSSGPSSERQIRTASSAAAVAAGTAEAVKRKDREAIRR